MSKPILISLSPNTDSSDVRLAFRLLFQPNLWLKGKDLNRLSHRLSQLFSSPACHLLNSGRSALFLALKSLSLKPGDEIICQALTCVAVPNAIRWAGGQPVFADTVKNGFNLDINSLRSHLTPRTKAIILQHTFGQPDDLQAVKKLCRQHHLYLIEDCAHSLGAKYQKKLVGTFGDLTVLSFGRDKVVSSVFGGALLVNNPQLVKSVNSLTKSLKFPSRLWTLQQLFHPLIFSLVIPSYYSFSLGKFTLGKGLLFLAQKLRLISLPVSSKEKKSLMSLPVKQLPNALSALALHQLKQLSVINHHRQQISRLYYQHLQPLAKKKLLQLPPQYPQSQPIFMRFSILVDQPQDLINFARKHQLLLGNWYCPVIAPQGVNLKKIGYKPNSCPQAESVSRSVVNLPTYPRMMPADAHRVVKVIKQFFNYHD